VDIFTETELPDVVKTERFKSEFENYCKILSDPKLIYDTFFKMPSQRVGDLEDVSDMHVLLKWKLFDLQLLGEDSPKMKHELNVLIDEMNAITKDGLVFRLIFVTIGDNDQKTGFFEKLQARALPYMPSKGMKFGLNHVALQIGPYLIHWTDSSLVTIHPLASQSACAMIYPDEKFRIRDTEQIKKVCAAIAKFNLGNTYHAIKCNCQHFVWFMMDELNCKPKWKPNGHIQTFVEEISKCEIGVHEMKIRDFKGEKVHKLKDYEAFIAFCKDDSNVQKILALKEDELSDDQREYAALLKCVERAFQLHALQQREVVTVSVDIIQKLQATFNKAVFPMDTGSITGTPNAYGKKN